MRSIMSRAKEWLGFKRELEVAEDAQAEFLLLLDELPVGTLSVRKGKWKFEYSDEFRLKEDLRPLVEFPELDQVYEKEELWQFFALRIPSMEQPDVEDVLRQEQIAEDDAVALLRRFGKHTIANPFELKFKEAKT